MGFFPTVLTVEKREKCSLIHFVEKTYITHRNVNVWPCLTVLMSMIWKN